MNFVSLQT